MRAYHSIEYNIESRMCLCELLNSVIRVNVKKKIEFQSEEKLFVATVPMFSISTDFE